MLLVVAVRVQGMVVRDLQLVFVRLVAESITNHVICLREHASDVDRLGIMLNHILI